MKQDIDTIREGLSNHRQYLERRKLEFRISVINILSDISQYQIDKRQFDAAVLKRLPGFDRDRFMRNLIPFLHSEAKEKNEKKLKRIMEIVEE